jgi:hypothetical protein
MENEGAVMDPEFGGIADALPFLVLLIVAAMVHIEEKELQEPEEGSVVGVAAKAAPTNRWKRMIRG